MEFEKKKLLVVDDVELNRVVLGELFKTQFDVIHANNGKEALEMIKRHKNSLAIVLLDLVMPGMDGFEVVRAMLDMEIGREIPVIMITCESEDDKVLTGYTLGVADFIGKPFNPDIVQRRVNNTVELYSNKQELERKLREQKEMLEQQSHRLRMSNRFVIDALSTTVEFRSLESGQHITRVRAFTRILLEHLRTHYHLTAEEIETISNVSAMHDIGKIAIPDAILLKPGPLTKDEFETMKLHTVKGCEILESINYTYEEDTYRYCYEICRHHHERYDGSGYPDGLKGEDIPIWAQATSLADVYDALTSARVYKEAYTHEQAVEMIFRGECGQFNPRLIDCLRLLKDTLPELLHTGAE